MTDPSAPLRDLGTLAGDVPWPDAAAERETRHHRLPADPGRPSGPYGTLATTAEWLAGAQGVFPPVAPRDVRLVIVTARHLGVDDGRTIDDPGLARAALDDGTLPVLGLAATAGVRVEVIDAGEVGAPGVEDAAMTTQILDAIDLGANTADRLVDEGADLIVVTALAPGASTAASAVVAVLAITEPILVAGRGSGLDDEGWAVKTAAIRDARRRGMPLRTDVVGLLAAIGGRDLAVLVGLLLQAAGRRTPVLLDGVSAVAAALATREVTPRISRWIRLAHAGSDDAERHAVERLGFTPMSDLGLSGVGVTAGIGGVLAVQQLVTAATLADAILSFSPPDPFDEPAPVDDPDPADPV